MRFPIGMDPSLTRLPPNHTTATLDRFRISMSAGMVSAKTRFTRNVVAVRAAFAWSKRSRSESPRTKARITLTPVICSRSTSVIRSILTCIDRNCGTTMIITTARTSTITGTETKSRRERVASSRMAM